MTISNIYHEPNLVTRLQKEYIDLINYYDQVNRQSIFIKYYNINMGSVYDDQSFSTYDVYSASNIKFDIYEFTPAYFLQAITNRTMYGEDKAGHVLDGNSSLVLNTIHRPRINDLVRLYDPIESDEIFRVIGFSTPVNLLHSSPGSEWFELELEYAPIEHTGNLNILNHYVYDPSEEKNIDLNTYKEKIKKLNEFDEILKQISGSYYTKHQDLYVIDDMYVPIALNDLIYEIKKDYSYKFKRIIESHRSPYGFPHHTGLSLPYYDKNPFYYLDTHDNQLEVFNLTTNEFENYRWSSLDSNENELERSFSLTHQLAQLFAAIKN